MVRKHRRIVRPVNVHKPLSMSAHCIYFNVMHLDRERCDLVVF